MTMTIDSKRARSARGRYALSSIYAMTIFAELQNYISRAKFFRIKWKERQERCLKLEGPKIVSVSSPLHFHTGNYVISKMFRVILCLILSHLPVFIGVLD